MKSDRRQFLQVTTAFTAASTLSLADDAGSDKKKVDARPTCPTRLDQPTADKFDNGLWIQRQIPLKPLTTGTQPATWKASCPVGTGPCGIAKEFGASTPTGGKSEFLDDDDSSTAASSLPRLVNEFQSAQAKFEYYEVAIAQGKRVVHGLPEETGCKNETAFLGYGASASAVSWPGPLFQARIGRPMVIRFINEIEDYMSVHLHGSHAPAHSDGHPAFVIPKVTDKVKNYDSLPYGKNHRDYFYPHTVPAKEVNGQGERQLDYSESPSTMWYHDHSMDLTGPHVGLGLAGFCPIFDDLELELLKKNVLPFYPGEENKDKVGSLNLDEIFDAQKNNPLDVCLALQDRCFSQKNEILYSVEGHNGHLGHRVLVNGELYPRMLVVPLKYRVRLLNGSNARIYKLALYVRKKTSGGSSGGSSGEWIACKDLMGEKGDPEWFRIGADSWLYPKPVKQRKVLLTMANRADMIVDFGSIYKRAKEKGIVSSGERLEVFLCNLMDQKNGRGPNVKLDEAQSQRENVRDGDNNLIGIPSFYSANVDEESSNDELSTPWPLLKFVIEPNLGGIQACEDERNLLKGITLDDGKWNAKVSAHDEGGLRPHEKIEHVSDIKREILFHRTNGIWKINGSVIDEFWSNVVPELNSAEEWVLENGGGGWWHPIHIHLESHQQVEYLEELTDRETVELLGKLTQTFEPIAKDAKGNADGEKLEEVLTRLKAVIKVEKPLLDNPKLKVERSNPKLAGKEEPDAPESLMKQMKGSIQSLEQLYQKLGDSAKAREPSPDRAAPKVAFSRNFEEIMTEGASGAGGVQSLLGENLKYEDGRVWHWRRVDSKDDKYSIREWERYKLDTTVLGPNTRVKIRMKFRTFDGPFVFHCHNVEHEDMRMMFTLDPRPTPPKFDEADKKEYHSMGHPVLYRHPWRFSKKLPDFDKWAHEDKMDLSAGKLSKHPEWNEKPSADEPPRAHPIWGGWDQHL